MPHQLWATHMCLTRERCSRGVTMTHLPHPCLALRTNVHMAMWWRARRKKSCWTKKLSPRGLSTNVWLNPWGGSSSIWRIVSPREPTMSASHHKWKDSRGKNEWVARRVKVRLWCWRYCGDPIKNSLCFTKFDFIITFIIYISGRARIDVSLLMNTEYSRIMCPEICLLLDCQNLFIKR